MRFVGALIAAAALALLSAGSASATTFCVPDYTTACPNNGINVKDTDLEDAMNSNAFDLVPDTIYIGAYTYTDPDTLRSNGTSTDDLKMIGSGTDKTILTSSAITNSLVVNLNGTGDRSVDLSGVTVVIPASMPDPGGSGLQSDDGVLQRVEIESRNPGARGLTLLGTTTFTGGEIHGVAGGDFNKAVTLNDAGPDPGVVTFDKATIENAEIAITADVPSLPIRIFDSYIDSVSEAAFAVTDGGSLEVQNSVVNAGAAPYAFEIAADHDVELKDGQVNVESSTIVGDSQGTGTAINNHFLSGVGTGDVTINVRNSIIRGFQFTWNQDPEIGPGFGKAALKITDSNFPKTSPETSSGGVDVSDPGNIDGDPKFTGAADFHLTDGSPSIDAADPASPIAIDIEGNGRPKDGDKDGTKVNDQGAYEFVPLPDPTCATDPAVCPADKVKPKITKVKFKSPKGKKKGSLKLTLSEEAKITATFKPKPKGKRKTVTLKKAGRKGSNTLVIKKGKLKKGKYKLTITAKDAAGNKAKPVKKTVKVKK